MTWRSFKKGSYKKTVQVYLTAGEIFEVLFVWYLEDVYDFFAILASTSLEIYG